MSGRIRAGFWRDKLDLVRREVIPYQWKALNDQVPGAEPSHAFENFRIVAGEAQGEFVGTIFQDSDVAKWIEAASYALADAPDATLEAQVDEAIRLIGRAQGDDGYINTWFTLVGQDKRWSDLPWGHELYCGGHLIEASVAHYQATGKTTFLAIMRRFADGLVRLFGPGGAHSEDVCGHPEIELALHRLADATGEPSYRALAHHFVDVRGLHPDRFHNKPSLTFNLPFNQWFDTKYFLAHAPVRHQHHADGHAVRAMYLYTAMAVQAQRSSEAELTKVLEELWTSVTERRMYVTGGIGSHAMAERFTIDYDLPSDTVYAETCASIGLVFWARAMAALTPHRRYADTAERALYNGVLSGMALDGRRFFYVNPLQVVPSVVAARQDHEHVKPARVPWLGCACCPPNLARLITSLPAYLGNADEREWRVDHYLDLEGTVEGPGGRWSFDLGTHYPWEGEVRLTVTPPSPKPWTLALRIPSWCRDFNLLVNGKPEGSFGEDGYLRVTRVWKAGDTVSLTLDMPVRVVQAHSGVLELAGQVSVARGPLVYCAEQVDNGPNLHQLTLDPRSEPTVEWKPDLMGGTTLVRMRGRRQQTASEGLYQPWGPGSNQSVELVFVPYHQWGNRRPGEEMRVWLREERS